MAAIIEFRSNLTEIRSQESNAKPNHWRIYATLEGDELNIGLYP